MKTCKRIYNKKVFAFGVVMIGLGCLNLICDLVTDRIDVNGIILIVWLSSSLAVSPPSAAFRGSCPGRISWMRWTNAIS